MRICSARSSSSTVSRSRFRWKRWMRPVSGPGRAPTGRASRCRGRAQRARVKALEDEGLRGPLLYEDRHVAQAFEDLGGSSSSAAAAILSKRLGLTIGSGSSLAASRRSTASHSFSMPLRSPLSSQAARGCGARRPRRAGRVPSRRATRAEGARPRRARRTRGRPPPSRSTAPDRPARPRSSGGTPRGPSRGRPSATASSASTSSTAGSPGAPSRAFASARAASRQFAVAKGVPSLVQLTLRLGVEV